MASEALVQQIAEALHGFHYQGSIHWDETHDTERDIFRDYARAVLPLVEAQVAPLRDERDGLREAYNARAEECRRWQAEQGRLIADKVAAESALRQVREDLTALTTGVETLLDSGKFDNDVVMAFGRLVHASQSNGERRCIVHGGSPWPVAESRCAAGDPWDDGLVCADTQPEGAGEERWCTCGHAQTAHLHSAGPCTRPHEDWSGAQCDCRRFGEMALTRYAREVAAELAANTPTAGGKVDTAPEANEPRCVHCRLRIELGDSVPGWGLHAEGSHRGKSRCGSESGQRYGLNAHTADVPCEAPCAGIHRPADTAPESGEGR